MSLLLLGILTVGGSPIKTPQSANRVPIKEQVTLAQERTTNDGENKINKAVENRKGHWCNMEVTGYVDGKRTASGTLPSRGRTVAAPPEIPFGTRIYIDNIYFKGWPRKGWFTVEDRGGAVVGNVVDVYFGSSGAHDEAIKWGRRECRVLIVPKD